MNLAGVDVVRLENAPLVVLKDVGVRYAHERRKRPADQFAALRFQHRGTCQMRCSGTVSN
ncbi:MAG: hypothetical protein JW993_07685 [Sedimentisphaerales bacterium]|nr:hypothetical protein [Sedimentisphaerales bacterium]